MTGVYHVGHCADKNVCAFLHDLENPAQIAINPSHLSAYQGQTKVYVM